MSPCALSARPFDADGVARSHSRSRLRNVTHYISLGSVGGFEAALSRVALRGSTCDRNCATDVSGASPDPTRTPYYNSTLFARFSQLIESDKMTEGGGRKRRRSARQEVINKRVLHWGQFIRDLLGQLVSLNRLPKWAPTLRSAIDRHNEFLPKDSLLGCGLTFDKWMS